MKDYAEINKLRILKINTTGATHSMVAEFYRSSFIDVIDVVPLLDKTYGSDMVIRKCFENIQWIKVCLLSLSKNSAIKLDNKMFKFKSKHLSYLKLSFNRVK